MIKVLAVCTVPFKRKGITNVMMNLFHNISKDEIQMDIVVTYDNFDEEYRDEIIANGGKFYILHRSMRHLMRYIKELCRVSKGYDVIHVHGNSATMAIDLLAAKLAGVKTCIGHGHNTSCAFRIVDKLLRPLFYTLCDVRLACGEKAGKWLYRRHSFTVINNGIDTKKFRFDDEARLCIRRKLKWQENKIIGHVGNFLDVKNHEFIIDVFFQLLKLDTNYRLLLLGEGELLETIEEKAQMLGISDKTIFAGSVSNVAEYLSAMDIVIMPSKYEGVPLTLIEEQANGLQCFVSSTISEEVNLSGLVKFLPLDLKPKLWAEHIDNSFIGNDRMQNSIKAIDKIEKAHFDIREQANKLYTIYMRDRMEE